MEKQSLIDAAASGAVAGFILGFLLYVPVFSRDWISTLLVLFASAFSGATLNVVIPGNRVMKVVLWLVRFWHGR